MLWVGFIGTGNFATQHAEVLQELDAIITACYGTNADKTRMFSEKFNCKIFQQPFDLIAKNILAGKI